MLVGLSAGSHKKLGRRFSAQNRPSDVRVKETAGPRQNLSAHLHLFYFVFYVFVRPYAPVVSSRRGTRRDKRSEMIESWILVGLKKGPCYIFMQIIEVEGVSSSWRFLVFEMMEGSNPADEVKQGSESEIWSRSGGSGTDLNGCLGVDWEVDADQAGRKKQVVSDGGRILWAGGQRSCLSVRPLTSVSSDSRPLAGGLNKQKGPISTVLLLLLLSWSLLLLVWRQKEADDLVFSFVSVLSLSGCPASSLHLLCSLNFCLSNLLSFLFFLCHSLILPHTLD